MPYGPQYQLQLIQHAEYLKLSVLSGGWQALGGRQISWLTRNRAKTANLLMNKKDNPFKFRSLNAVLRQAIVIQNSQSFEGFDKELYGT